MQSRIKELEEEKERKMQREETLEKEWSLSNVDAQHKKPFVNLQPFEQFNDPTPHRLNKSKYADTGLASAETSSVEMKAKFNLDEIINFVSSSWDKVSHDPSVHVYPPKVLG